MIKFEGIRFVNKVPFIGFSNDSGGHVEVPLDALTAERITRYLAKIAPGSTPVERGNDEPPEAA
ncbi:MAG TPA: hypothetical protein VI423_11645 [Paenisporosarcina sp.]|nr:hypothetical protein [Paenisporosarcina sp.]